MGEGEVVDLFAPASGRESSRDTRTIRGGAGHEARGEQTWTPSKNYSPQEFYIRSEAKGGKASPSISARLLPDVHRWLMVMLAERVYPYGTITDFVRDATLHRMHQLAEMGQNHRMRDFVLLQAQIARSEMIQNEINANVKVVTDLKASASIAIEHDDWEALADIVLTANDTVDVLRHPYAGQLKRAAKEWWAKFPPEYIAIRPNIYAERPEHFA